jgi:hypothetical protein
VIGASMLGLGFAAPAILSLLEYFGATVRASKVALFEPNWSVPPPALVGLILPTFSTRWFAFGGELLHASVELAGGLIPLAGFAAMMCFDRYRLYRDRWAELLLLGFLLLAVVLPSAGPFRWSFRWLPLFHLVLAIVGLYALELALRQRRNIGSLITATLVGGAMSIELIGDRSLSPSVVLALTLLASCGLWFAFSRGGGGAFFPVWITVASIVITFVFMSRNSDVPRWELTDAVFDSAPYDPARSYLAMYEIRDVLAESADERLSNGIAVGLRPGNLPMFAQLQFVNGYSPLSLEGLVELTNMQGHGSVWRQGARRLLRDESGDGGLLEQMGVDGLVVGNRHLGRYGATLEKRGWRAVGKIERSTIFHHHPPSSGPAFAATSRVELPTTAALFRTVEQRKTTELPITLLSDGKARATHYEPRALSQATESRLRSSVMVAAGPREALIVFRRPWFSGWRATLDGRSLPVRPAHLLLPSVEIPAGAGGRLEIRFLPRSVVVGIAISAASALIATIAMFVIRRRPESSPSRSDGSTPLHPT